jgi:hypothetical protein
MRVSRRPRRFTGWLWLLFLDTNAGWLLVLHSSPNVA